MAQERDPAGPGDDQAAEAGEEQPESPETWGDAGLVGDGRYRLTRRLGRGGMADVFAAEDVRLGRTVAVKLLRPDLAEDAVAKARFAREAQSVAGLNHHAVVAVYDSGEERTAGVTGVVPYIVMELIDGLTIRDLLRRERAPGAEEALRIVSGVLEALAYSHQHGIVHRDIKPANVIITGTTGAVKVMDFGIARALHGAQQTMTQTGMVMGTPQYLSPEQALGKAVDTRSDLYAVGCLLFELLTGRPPFVGETPLSVVYQHVQDAPPQPSRLAPSAPPELDGLVLRALAKNPDDRFQSAEEMRALVTYALRMLAEHGGHTHGLWNTGATTADTPAMGTPALAAPSATAPTRVSAPLHLGDPGAGGQDRTTALDMRRSGAGGGRLRYLLLALLAVLAIGVGTLFALNPGDDSDGGTTGGETTSGSDGTTGDPQPPAEGGSSDSAAETEEPSTPWGPSDDQPTTTAPETSPGEDGGATDEPGTDEGATGGEETTGGEAEGATTDGGETTEGATTDGATTDGGDGGATDETSTGETSGGGTTAADGGGDGGGSDPTDPATGGETTEGATTEGGSDGTTTDGSGTPAP